MRVLLVEDDPQQAALVRALLAKRHAAGAGAAGSDLELDHAETVADASRRTAADYHVILLDLNLPDSQGLQTLRHMRHQAPDTPIVILSSEDDTAIAIQALHEGAQDYLLKGEWPRDLLVRSIRYAIERHRTERRLREREWERDRLLRALSERVRELAALHETSKLLQINELWDAQLVQRLVPIIIPAWQHPDVTEVRITAGAISASSPGFQETPWMQAAAFHLVDGSAGRIEVAYTEARPDADEGPFLNEERQALTAIAEMLRNCLNGRIAQRQLQAREAEYRTSFEMAPVGKAHAECGSWRLTRVNPRLCEITGYSADELLAMTVLDLTHPDDRKRTLRLQADIEEGTLPSLDYEKRYLRKDGRTIWVHVTAAPIRLYGTDALQYVAVIEDVTAHKAAVAALAESERFARSVVDALKSNIAILDERGRIISINRAWRGAAARTGWEGGACGVGADYLGICDESARCGSADAARAVAGIRRVLAGESDGFRLEYECSSPDEQRWHELSVTCFEGEGPRRLVVKHQDVTARRRTEALERERSALHDAVRVMDQVLSVVGHELRTPLAGLRLLSEFLLTDGVQSPEQRTQFLNNIHEEVVRMAETVNNLLEAARLDSGRARWNWGEYCPGTVAQQAVESVRALADAAGNRLAFESHLHGRQFRGDADAVRRLVVNFLSNAIKHTSRGEIRVTLRISTAGAGSAAAEPHEWLLVEVADTGGGIPPHIRERLGEAFTLNSGVVGTRHVGGTGLGLSICRGIVEAHGGVIEVRSAPGEGTTMVARLRTDLEAPMAVGRSIRSRLIEREAA